MMMENTQNRIECKVHTAEIMLLSAEGADMSRDYHRDSRVTGAAARGKHRDEPVCYLRFNPNGLKVYSRETSRDVSIGTCESLEDFRLHVADWARVEDIPVESVAFSRVDFAVDYCTDEGADYFRQMCDMIMLAFNVKHKIPGKHQYYGETQTTMEHKNNKAHKPKGPFELECYRKNMQQEGSPARWRLEMRYIHNKKQKNRKVFRDILPMLEKVRAELRTLPEYYDKAQSVMNIALVRKYNECVTGSKGNVNLNAFVFLNRDRVFSKKQLKEIYAELGCGDTNKAVNNYVHRHKAHRLIEREDFVAFTIMLDNCIENWLKNEKLLGDFFEVRNGEKTNSLMIEPY